MAWIIGWALIMEYAIKYLLLYHGAITLRACLKVVVFISLNGYKWIT
jgi:hypothetical protein